jgi:hypothetical protein
VFSDWNLPVCLHEQPRILGVCVCCVAERMPEEVDLWCQRRRVSYCCHLRVGVDRCWRLSGMLHSTVWLVTVPSCRPHKRLVWVNRNHQSCACHVITGSLVSQPQCTASMLSAALLDVGCVFISATVILPLTAAAHGMCEPPS